FYNSTEIIKDYTAHYFGVTPTLSGVVYHDKNINGLLDDGEIGIPQVTIKLYKDDILHATNTTGINGTFVFPELIPGEYTIEEIDPTGYNSTTPNSVNETVSLSHFGYVSFGDKMQDSFGEVSIYVWEDLNKNGKHESQLYEKTVPDVFFNIYNSSGFVKTVQTESNPIRVKLSPGNYSFVEQIPSGYMNTTAGYLQVIVSNGDLQSVSYGIYEKMIGVNILRQVSGLSGVWNNYSDIAVTGQTVWFRSIVKNTGETNLTEIHVHDSDFGDIAIPDMMPGEEYTTGNYSLIAVDTHGYYGEAIVHAKSNGNDLETWDYCLYIGGNAEISLVKEIKTSTGYWENSNVFEIVNSTVYYRFTVINTGYWDLKDLKIYDDDFGNISITITLHEGATYTLYKDLKAEEGYHENNAKATMQVYYGKPYYVYDETTASYNAKNPALNLDKQIYGLDGQWHNDTVTLLVDTQVQYRYIITNIGDVPIYLMDLGDNVLG
ncbi:MAG: hypothetical protein E4G94_07965, partial [ANME-2 cluster archaeon]